MVPSSRISRVSRGTSRRLMLPFVLLLLLPAIVAVWLGIELLRQDADIEARQFRERRESVADRLAASLEQVIASSERQMQGGAGSVDVGPDDDAAFVTFDADGVDAFPTRLLYVPELPHAPRDPAAVFERPDNLEYRLKDSAGALAVLRGLAQSSDGQIRAGALVREARNLRKLGRRADALQAYRELSRMPHVFIFGLPADLVGRRALCATLDESGRRADRDTEARILRDDLIAGRWSLDRGTFTSYVGQIDDWLGTGQDSSPERMGLAAATDWLWHQRGAALPESGRRAMQFADFKVTILWQRDGARMRALLAGPRYQQRAWFGTLTAAANARGVDVALAGPDDQPLGEMLPVSRDGAVRRKAAETGLPWTIYVGSRGSGEFPNGAPNRRRTLLGGLVLVLVLVFAGGYFITRAVSRELAVAKLQSDFVDAVSHEFRSPLTSLQQFTALLSDANEPPPAKRQMFYQAQSRGVERLLRLVESLLDFGRMEAGAHLYQPAPVDAAVFVRQVLAEFERNGNGGLAIEADVPESGPWIRADQEALSRALWNLLDNAVKYSSTSRRIVVSLDIGIELVSIRVQDFGFGIPRNEQEGIFMKFVRGEVTRTYGITGTGIGLAMVRRITDAHDGIVRVESTPGAGSTFVIELPRVDAARPVATAAVTEDPSCRAF